MSSPLDVNGLFAWLNDLFGLHLPLLPLKGFLSPFTALWELLLAGPLPPPDDPFPWIIAVEGTWSAPAGAIVVLTDIRIIVGEEGSPPTFGRRLRNAAKKAATALRPKRKRKRPPSRAGPACRDPAVLLG